jgi:hypothetical protein
MMGPPPMVGAAQAWIESLKIEENFSGNFACFLFVSH